MRSAQAADLPQHHNSLILSKSASQPSRASPAQDRPALLARPRPGHTRPRKPV